MPDVAARLAAGAGFVVSDDAPLAPGVGWEAAWAGFPERWARFVSAPAEGLSPRTPADDALALQRGLEAAVEAHRLDDPRGAARTAAARIAVRLTSTEQRLAPSLGGLDEQRLALTGGQLALRSIDDACAAEPGRDLAHLAVTAMLRVAERRWRRDEAEAVWHAVITAAGLLGVAPERLQLLQQARALAVAAQESITRPAFAQQWLTIWLTKPVLA